MQINLFIFTARCLTHKIRLRMNTRILTEMIITEIMILTETNITAILMMIMEKMVGKQSTTMIPARTQVILEHQHLMTGNLTLKRLDMTVGPVEEIPVME